MNELLTLSLMAIPAAFVAWTICQEEIFADLREWAKSHSRHHSRVVRKLAYLPTCYFCTGTWCAAFFLLLNPVEFVTPGLRGLLMAWFTLSAVEQVYLNAFNLIRVALRWSRAKADHAEKQVNQPMMRMAA